MQIHTPRRAFVAGMLAVPFAPRSGLAQSAKLSQAVDAAARDFMAATNVPGLAIGLIGPQERRIFNYGLSYPASGTPCREWHALRDRLDQQDVHRGIDGCGRQKGRTFVERCAGQACP